MGSIVKTIGQETPKNLLWNSGMNFRQRIATGTTALSAGYTYRMDRWTIRYDAVGTWTGTPTIDQNTDVPTNSLSKFSMNLAGTPNGSTTEFDIAQRLEGVETRRLLDKKVSFSFWVKTDCWTQASLRILTPSAEDNFAAITGGISTATKTLVANGTWQQIKVENIDMSTVTNAANGLEIRVEFNGATNTGAARFLRVTQVMLNVGEEAAPWIMRGESLSAELVGCQRYYEQSYDVTATPGLGTGTGAVRLTLPVSTATSGYWATNAFFKATKRAVPTLQYYSIAGTAGKTTFILASDNVGGDSSVSGVEDIGTSGFTVYTNNASSASNFGYAYQWTADSEL